MLKSMNFCSWEWALVAPPQLLITTGLPQVWCSIWQRLTSAPPAIPSRIQGSENWNSCLRKGKFRAKSIEILSSKIEILQSQKMQILHSKTALNRPLGISRPEKENSALKKWKYHAAQKMEILHSGNEKFPNAIKSRLFRDSPRQVGQFHVQVEIPC